MNNPIYKYTNNPIPNETQKTQIFFNQLKLLLPLIGSLALLGYWFIGLLSSIYAQEPPTSISENLRLEEYACNAFDPASFKACLQEAKNTSLPFIKIIAPIICETRNDCTFELKNISSNLRISPLNDQAKFIRREDYGYTVFNMENSSKVEFVGLTFEDEGVNGCFIGSTCNPFFIVKNSSDIIFDKVTFQKTHGASLLIENSRNTTVTNSNFKNSYRTGVEVKTTGFTQNIKIENNTFEGNSGTGLVFQAQSLAGESTIKSNKFTNNHSAGAYSNCVYPCIGAQIKIPGPTSNLRVFQNTVVGGINTAFDNLGLYASGIEISGSNLSNTTLICNEISSNRGSGIVQTTPFVNIKEVSVSENKIWGNGLNLNIPTVTADENNCFTKECKLSCM